MNPISLIKEYLNLIIGIVIALLTFYLSSLYYNHKIDKINNDYNNYKNINEKNIQAQKISILEQTNKLNKENLALQDKLKEVENEKYKQFTELQKANNIIKSNVANNNNRLYINAKCTESTNNTDSKTANSSTTGLDDGNTSKAVIDSRDASAIIEITNKADKYKEQLEALQIWVKKLIDENNKGELK